MEERFEKAMKVLVAHEGGWVNNPNDGGGETYRGIARTFHPSWDGWAIVDRVKEPLGVQPSYGTPEYWVYAKKLNLRLAADKGLQEQVEVFYQRNFWLPIYNQITSDLIAVKVFDMAVNMGHSQAHKLIQRAAGVADDGVFGKITVAAVNAVDPLVLIQQIKAQAEIYYRAIVKKNSKKREFLPTWLARSHWPLNPEKAFV